MRKYVSKFKTGEGNSYSITLAYQGDVDPAAAKAFLEGVSALHIFENDDGVDLTATPVSMAAVEETSEDVVTN